jgi:hypothetical protein
VVLKRSLPLFLLSSLIMFPSTSVGHPIGGIGGSVTEGIVTEGTVILVAMMTPVRIMDTVPTAPGVHPTIITALLLDGVCKTVILYIILPMVPL